MRKSAGIFARFIKENAGVVSEPLTKLLNKSLQNGVFPGEWKRCYFITVHKDNSADITPAIFVPFQLPQWL